MEHWLDMGKICHCDKFRLTKAFQYLLPECSCESSTQYRSSEENNLSIVQCTLWNLVTCLCFTLCFAWKSFLFVSGKTVHKIPSFTIDGLKTCFQCFQVRLSADLLALHASFKQVNRVLSQLTINYPTKLINSVKTLWGNIPFLQFYCFLMFWGATEREHCFKIS